MSDENVSKRERQKQRRQERLRQEESQAQAARRNRLLSFTLIALLVAGVLGYFVQDFVSGRQELQASEQAAAAKLDDLGCTEASLQEDLGGTHLRTDPQSLAASPPDQLYPDRPTSSGPHMPQVVASGVYDVHLDERLTTHNLEHGYIIAWYDEQADPEQVEELKSVAQEELDGDHPKMIAAPWMGDLPDGNFAYVAWNYRQVCDEFDVDVFRTFANNHYENDRAPERFVPVHTGSGQGVLSPEGEDLLFPPLSEDGAGAEGAGQATEQPTEDGAGGAGDATEAPAEEEAG